MKAWILAIFAGIAVIIFAPIILGLFGAIAAVMAVAIPILIVLVIALGIGIIVYAIVKDRPE